MAEKRATGRGGNAMVKSEIEAAEALAGLACTEVVEPSRRRAKTESPPRHNSVSDQTAALRLSDSPDEAVGDQRQCEKIYTINTNKANVDCDSEINKPRTGGSRSHTYISGSKSRDKMTEDEKEARRIRRVLANRESARQTIRRRQALYEELIGKAASLAQENESLKKEMDMATQEYDSLKTTNESLKSQMLKVISSELDEPRADIKPTSTETSKSMCQNCPFMVYNQNSPFPFIWPALFHPQNVTQTGINLFPEKTNIENKDDPNPPLYILPYPFFYPVSDHGVGPPLMPCFDSKNDQIVPPKGYSYACGSSTKTIGYEEAKAESSISKNTNVGLSVLIKPIPRVKLVMGPQSEFISSDRALGSTSTSTLDRAKEKKLDLNICPSKKQADIAAAAEARKRRKELTKLKSLHFREYGRV